MFNTKGFTIYLNDKYVGQISSRAKAAAKRWVISNVTATHMGEWLKHPDGALEYCTTIGAYYKFEPAMVDSNK